MDVSENVFYNIKRDTYWNVMYLCLYKIIRCETLKKEQQKCI